MVAQESEITVADGSLVKADNIVIDNTNVIQSRRGFNDYSQVLNTPPSQLFTYKNKLLVHHGTTLSSDNVANTGAFTDYAGVFNELVSGLRLKGLEASGNFYFTSDTGIKKISAATTDDVPSSVITQAGGIAATDLSAVAVLDAAGFLPAQSKVAYRLVFGTKDNNTNLILGAPSDRVVVTNQTADININEVFTVNFLTANPAITNSQYWTFDTPDNGYYVWYNLSGTAPAPVNGDTISRTGVEVSMAGIVSPTNAQFASYTANALSAITEINAQLSGSEVQVTMVEPGDAPDVGQGNISATEMIVTNIVDGSITTGTPAKVSLNFTLPQTISTDYFYQVYRTGVVTVGLSQILNDIDPGDEEYFVYEAPITAADILAGEITVEDNTPEAFRASGAPLYTNALTGDGQGILGANTPPPIAQDITSFQSSAFYANTKDYHSFQLTMLSVDDFISGTTQLSIQQGVTTVDYTFVGVQQVAQITVQPRSSTTGGTYILLNSAGNERSYYIWFDTGSSTDPAIANAQGIRVPLQLYPDTAAGSKEALLNSLLLISDFTASDSGANTVDLLWNEAGDSIVPTTTSSWTITVTTPGEGEDSSAREVLLSKSASVGIAIDSTARSLVRVINRDSGSPVTAQYLSSAEDLPGKILLKAKSQADVKFYVKINDPALSAEFTPNLPTAFNNTAVSDNLVVPNRLMFSKIGQPEAVPLPFYIDIGSKNKAILRVLPLRDNLFVLKEDGIFIVTGSAAPDFSVKLLDNSAICIAPDTAVVLNNLIYVLTTQGVVGISESGVSIVSRLIEDKIKAVTTFNYNYKYTSFGVSYETDRAYILWLPMSKTDTVATQAYRYNTITNTWTRWTKTNSCGIVNYLGDDRLYLGDSSRSLVERERKNGERQDYSDRTFTRSIGADAWSDTNVTLSSTLDVSVGDVITQEQYATVPKFNRLLSKLDRDNAISVPDYRATLELGVGANLANGLIALVAKLNAEPNLSGTFSTPSGSNTLLGLQTAYNTLISELNNVASGTVLKDYKPVTDLLTYEILITDKAKTGNMVTVNFSTWFIQGDVQIHKGIATEVEWAPQHFGSPQLLKQVNQGTVIFDQGTIYSASVSYSADRSADFVEIPFTMSGPGFWVSFPWLNTIWGGSSNSVNLRTLIPQDKQRCRYLGVKFKHVNAREQFKLIGISLEERVIGPRAYKATQG